MKGKWLALVLVFSVASVEGTGIVPLQATVSSNATALTFARDLAPVVFAHCAPCHHVGGSAPFPLVTYTDVRGRARQVVDAVTRRAMPPWKPEPGPTAFIGERRLSDAQIALFQQWLAQGAQAGSMSEMPPPPAAKEGWTLGPPDLVVKLPVPYRMDPVGPDRLRQFVLPVPITAVRYVKAWQFKTTGSAVVHHATFLLDSTPASRRLDEADPQPGYEGLVPLSARHPDGYFLGWTPGQTPYVATERMAWRIDVGDDLVAMLHLMPNGHTEGIDLSVGLYFTTAPPVDQPVMIRLNRQDIDIPSGDRSYTVVDAYTLPVPVDVYGIQPHAHHLAREVKGEATLPDGTRRGLIHIKEWDFHWQDVYLFAEPIPLPAGTTLSMEFRYDNSEGNPRNPSRPPRRVTYGQRTSEEMGDLWIQVLPRRAADGATLSRSLRARLVPQLITGYGMMLRADPDSVSLHDDLAMLFVEAGDLTRAAAEFAESLRLSPISAAAHYNLGNALLGLRRFDEAEARFLAAIGLAPDYGLASHGLALVMVATGRDELAVRHFEHAARVTGSADSHYQFGALLERQGNAMEALRHYEQASRLRPDWPAAHLALAWLLSTAADPGLRNPVEALRLAEAAAARSDEEVRALDVLAAALAASGQFERAVATLREALRRAENAAGADAVRSLQHRLSLYSERRAFVDSASVR